MVDRDIHKINPSPVEYYMCEKLDGVKLFYIWWIVFSTFIEELGQDHIKEDKFVRSPMISRIENSLKTYF